MSLKLYLASGACSFVPHCLLEASGAPFEPVMIKLHRNEQNSDEYRAVNPRGQVPVLVDDGAVITQIVALVCHLDARFPGTHMLPPGGLARTRALEALMWMNNTVHPTFTHIFMPYKFTDSATAQAEIKAFNLTLYRGLLGELQALVRQAGAAGQPFLAESGFGALDAYTLTLTRWGTLAGIDPTGYPDLWAFVQRVAQVPAAQRAIERERLQLNLYKPV
jgi:glutathione S-transferase